MFVGLKQLYESGIRLNGEPSDLSAEERCKMFQNGYDFSKKPYASILVHAVRFKQYDMVKYLLEKGEDDVNAYDENGYNCLRVATEDDNKEMIRLLKRYGAKLD